MDPKECQRKNIGDLRILRFTSQGVELPWNFYLLISTLQPLIPWAGYLKLTNVSWICTLNHFVYQKKGFGKSDWIGRSALYFEAYLSRFFPLTFLISMVECHYLSSSWVNLASLSDGGGGSVNPTLHDGSDYVLCSDSQVAIIWCG